MAELQTQSTDLGQDVLPPPVDSRGRVIDEVPVEIDYAIIEHFSKHLYGSPNKAIEELVSNGFDALASSTYVYIPGSFTEDRVLVWDNGQSMQVEDLHKLWWIAQSPKVGDRIAHGLGRTRAMIGKFGIGKLASYAVGNRITHLCRVGDRFLRISVDYRGVPHLREGEQRKAYRAPVMELTELEARAYAESLFRQTPAAMTQLWDQKHWTLAVIDELKEDTRLSHGRLNWILGNGMPLRPDFRVWLNDAKVESRLNKDAAVTWDASEPKLHDALVSAWKSAQNKGDVSGDLEFLPSSVDIDHPPSVHIPALGTVRIEVRLFDESLLDKQDRDLPHSYGFFIMVRGRLLNEDDDKVLLHEPSFGAFYRSQFVIYADSLDEDLLADRERLHSDTPRTRALTVLQRAMYLAARNELEQRDESAKLSKRSESLLPIDSREYFREPFTALLLRHQHNLHEAFDLSHARIERSPLDENQPLAILAEDGHLKVNEAHPLFDSIRRKLGEGKKAQEAFQVFDLLAASDRLLEGFLYDIGIPDQQIARILDWRDGLFRSIAGRFDVTPLEEVVREVRETSFQGSNEFEKALTKLFELMGFVAQRDGAPGKKDVLVVAPIGEKEYRITVEAKGSKGAVGNDDAEVGGAASHRDDAGACLAIIVARDFAGFDRKNSEVPAILKECRSAGNVSIVTVDTLEELYNAIHRYAYPLDMILPVLASIESPTEKMDRVHELQHPIAGFDFRGVLEEIWQRQQGEAAGDKVPYRAVWQSRPDRWGHSWEDFESRLVGLEALAGSSLVRISPQQQVITLLQKPEIVAEHIQRAVEHAS